MTLVQHLEELRRRLLVCAAAVMADAPLRKWNASCRDSLNVSSQLSG